MIARWGLLPTAAVAGVLGWGAWLLPPGWPQGLGASIAALGTLFVLWFFRCPSRRPPPGEHRLVAPADGTVWDIADVNEPAVIGGPARRIGIFLSVLDVHVNRAPCSGTVIYAAYRPGRFLDARHPEAAEANEANTLGIACDPAVGRDLRIVVRQIAGLIARRIVCTHGLGDRLQRGELYGMIRFGSRTELLVPLDRPHRVLVKPGERVRGGETVLVEFLPEGDG
ncbi:MAG: phosphatidylserine decarboxylase [Planctomycetota bacterium]|nr:phosphatidylserine decarboxylase [Planctomycetota bacterium]MCX8040246.1 phosphatidylserine decarboxylase [Planctomycetota bacterium]MDW8372459.1 phosphatidylserine decarboxylase [Planctomycetota bacterium]